MSLTQEKVEKLDQLFKFFTIIDKEKEIFRQTYLADGTRKENDAEHAWHMAIMVILLKDYANEPIDELRTIEMLLVHDLVEIYAGDTYAYDEEGKKTQRKRELESADKLFGILQEEEQKLIRGLWDEFEDYETPEAKFAHTLDNLQPVLLNAASGGKGWLEKKPKISQIMERNKKTADGSIDLWEYVGKKYIRPNITPDKIQEDIEFDF
ncbi:HD domain-containing protein [Lachnobacterium bovis]|jgi:putative hydrolase of HD superfamily|uniref:Putative hydrolases of HD superfamily n=1 Tax=Lachnobacterium bovis DSM 14045 TaxID=1122142 RepID=A0A1H3F4M4_9FIRM|nr:HD domain-containing protein [Lachnobacterium bovis]SDX85931.1 putative hydrolases of HD superfamily [Lachnobacterium bovis DSM 14045]